MYVSIIAALLLGTGPDSGTDVGPFVRALWLVQRHGTADALDPANDQRVKGVLSKGLGKDGKIAFSKWDTLMDRETFGRLAGPDGLIDPEELRAAVEAAVPDSRRRLLPAIREHADRLTASFDLIDEPHRQAGRKLADWIADCYRARRGSDIVVVCTGNSRRSVLGATMGNIAAAYYGMTDVRFHSGGTDPTAFNIRTVRALQEIGVEVEPTGTEAPRGEPKTVNPVYRVRWGSPGGSEETAFESIEFSKRYDDPANPHRGFAALLVCSEADSACPNVKGAALRLSMPYLDPKVYDGGAYEAAKYAERRDDIGRLTLSVLMQARRTVESESNRAERKR